VGRARRSQVLGDPAVGVGEGDRRADLGASAESFTMRPTPASAAASIAAISHRACSGWLPQAR
jgi:hypothetical protein